MNADAGRPGSGPARLALEYLTGRLDGTLDLSGRPLREGESQARPGWRQVALIDAPDERWENWLPQHGITRIRRWDQELHLPGTAVHPASAADRQPGGTDVASAGETAGAGPRGLASRGLTATLAGAELVLLRVPKDRGLFRAYLDAARQLAPGALVVAAGAIKHMDPSFTEDMRARFPRVDVSPAAHKARLLIAGDPATGDRTVPVTAQETLAAAQPAGWEHPVDIRIDAESGLTVHALHGTFHGAGVDAGSRLLTRALTQAFRASTPRPRSVVEMGCGNGWLSAWLARQLRPDHLWACDVSRLAVDSTVRTLAANGLTVPDADADVDAGAADEPAVADSGGPRIRVVLDDVLASFPAAALHPGGGWPAPDLLVCNPPFHTGAAVDTSAAQRMIRAAGEVLAPGGVAVFVYNSHLRYRPVLERWIGPVEQLARDRRFTVVAASGRYWAPDAPEVG